MSGMATETARPPGVLAVVPVAVAAQRERRDSDPVERNPLETYRDRL